MIESAGGRELRSYCALQVAVNKGRTMRKRRDDLECNYVLTS